MSKELMSKQFLGKTFLCLLVILGIGVLVVKQKNVSNNTGAPVVQQLNPDSRNIVLPIAIDNPNTGSVLLHYFLSGTLEEVKNTKDGYVISLSGAKDLPLLLLGSNTRISRITPPYGADSSVPLTVENLKKGMAIDISLEYDLRSSLWMIHDVFVPTDKNK